MSLATAPNALESIDVCTIAVASPRPPHASAPIATAAVRGEHVVTLALRHAGRRRVSLRYEVLGDLALPPVFVAGGISAGRHLAASAAFEGSGWWGAQVGSGRALDPARFCLIAFDWLGGDGALDCVIDPVDQADAIAALLDALQIARLHAFVGCSYGAMVGLQFAARHGHRLGRLLAISGVHRAHPYASALRALQRRAVELGALQCDAAQGLALARQLAILSYRTAEEFGARFAAAEVVGDRVRVAAEDYLDHCSASYVARTPTAGFVRLSESIDLQALEPEHVFVPVTVVAVAEDRLVPLEDARALVARLGGEARLVVMHSPYGHDAFLKEDHEIAVVLRDTLDADVQVAA